MPIYPLTISKGQLFWLPSAIYRARARHGASVLVSFLIRVSSGGPRVMAVRPHLASITFVAALQLFALRVTSSPFTPGVVQLAILPTSLLAAFAPLSGTAAHEIPSWDRRFVRGPQACACDYGEAANFASLAPIWASP